MNPIDLQPVGDANGKSSASPQVNSRSDTARHLQHAKAQIQFVLMRELL
jgi:hypothetical protein